MILCVTNAHWAECPYQPLFAVCLYRAQHKSIESFCCIHMKAWPMRMSGADDRKDYICLMVQAILNFVAVIEISTLESCRNWIYFWICTGHLVDLSTNEHLALWVSTPVLLVFLSTYEKLWSTCKERWKP